jgi:tetratricopeptide (TPR) repeat protein
LRNELATTNPEIAEFHCDLAASHRGFGRLLAATGRVRQAEQAYRAALATHAGTPRPPACGQTSWPDQQELVLARHDLGVLLAHLGRCDESERLYREALAACEDSAAGLFPCSRSTERAELHSDLGHLLHSQGRLEEAETEYRKTLATNGPADPATKAVLAEARDRVGVLLHATARLQEAEKNFELARRSKTQLAKAYPDVPAFHGGLAWFLAHCPDERFRDPAQAVTSAATACDLAPLDGNQWVCLGAARYRADDWGGASAALEKARERGNAMTPIDGLFLAMSRWQAGDRQEAQRCYQVASAQMEKRGLGDEELRRLLAEAKVLIASASAGSVGVNGSLH